MASHVGCVILVGHYFAISASTSINAPFVLQFTKIDKSQFYNVFDYIKHFRMDEYITTVSSQLNVRFRKFYAKVDIVDSANVSHPTMLY